MKGMNDMNYLELFTSAVRRKERFMALAGAILGQANDLMVLVREGFPQAYTLESAVGAQLDALGALADTPRPAGCGDEDYRFLLRARRAAQRWDGTNGGIPRTLEEAFPGRDARMTDNQDGSVTLRLAGPVPFPLDQLFPLPAGINGKEE